MDVGPFLVDGVELYRAFIRLRGEDTFETLHRVANRPTELWGYERVTKPVLLASQKGAPHYHVDFPGAWVHMQHDDPGLDFWFRSKETAILCKLAVSRLA